MNRNALDEVIERAGGRKAFARALDVSMSAVEKWALGEREPRPTKILQMEAMWGVPRERLMPALFRVGLHRPNNAKKTLTHQRKNITHCPIDNRDQM